MPIFKSAKLNKTQVGEQHRRGDRKAHDQHPAYEQASGRAVGDIGHRIAITAPGKFILSKIVRANRNAHLNGSGRNQALHEGSNYQRGNKYGPACPARDPIGETSMKKMMMIPLAAVTALAAGCASTGGYCGVGGGGASLDGGRWFF